MIQNRVVKVTSAEEFNQAINYWKNRGIEELIGFKYNPNYQYFGYVKNNFDNYKDDYGAEVVILPKQAKRKPMFGEMIHVLDNNNEKFVKRIFLFFDREGFVHCVNKSDEKDFLNKDQYTVTIWELWELIPQKTKLTLQDISDGKGVGVPADQIEIVQS